MFHRQVKDQLWAYEDGMDQAYLAAILDHRSHQLAQCLCNVAQRLDPEHPISAEWLRQVGKRVASQSQLLSIRDIHRWSALEGVVKDQLAGLLEIVRPVVRAEYLIPLERETLTQCLKQLDRLVPSSNGHGTVNGNHHA